MRRLLNYSTLNGILFYVAWYACIYGAALDFELLGVFLTLGLIATHYVLSPKKGKDLIFLALFLTVGFLGDYFLLSLDLISYPFVTFDLTTFGVPLWVLAIYASFSTTINHSMGLIHHFPIFSSLSGGFGGSVSYYLAAKMGAIGLPLGNLSLFAIGVYWFLILIGSKVIFDLLEGAEVENPG